MSIAKCCLAPAHDDTELRQRMADTLRKAVPWRSYDPRTFLAGAIATSWRGSQLRIWCGHKPSFTEVSASTWTLSCSNQSPEILRIWDCADLALPKALSKLTALSELRISMSDSSLYDDDFFDEPLQLSSLPLAAPGLRHLQLTEKRPLNARAPFRTLLPGQFPGNPTPFPIHPFISNASCPIHPGPATLNVYS